MKPYVHATEYVMWSVDSSVGKGGSNNSMADVCFIQWYYTMAALRPETPEDRKAVYRNVKVTGQCTGREDDPLVQAITIHQRALNHPVVDGKISPASGNAGFTRIDGHATQFVFRLGARFAIMCPDVWPRLDKIPGCPPSVAEAVRAIVPKLP